MAKEPEPRFCPQRNASVPFESFMCNLYVRTKNWVKPVHGDVMATVLAVKGSEPRNLFKEHGEGSDRFCVWRAEKRHHQPGKYYDPST
eukprot:759466-Lingulodinium_polyedra.AAC.1